MRIDAHVHLWTLARGDYGWLTPKLAPIYRDFGITDLAPVISAAAIDGVLLVQAAPTEAETMFMLSIAERNSLVRGVVGWIDFDSEDAERRIETLAAHRLLVGLRPMVQDIPDDNWLLKPALITSLTMMAKQNLAFDALALPRHLPRLLQVVDRHPDLQFVLDHCAKPQLVTGNIASWKDDVAELAKRPNVVCKLSGLGTEAARDWQIADLRPAVDHVLACFGPQRLIWASDWPVVNLGGGYAKWLAAAETLLAGLSHDGRAAIFGGNAARIYLSRHRRQS